MVIRRTFIDLLDATKYFIYNETVKKQDKSKCASSILTYTGNQTRILKN
jgi:hypothetical protein